MSPSQRDELFDLHDHDCIVTCGAAPGNTADTLNTANSVATDRNTDTISTVASVA